MYCKEPGISIIFALSILRLSVTAMKVLLKFVVLVAWLVFAAALWQNRWIPQATTATSWSLPSLGMFSISRKVTEARLPVSSLTDRRSLAWPTPDLLIQLPASGF